MQRFPDKIKISERSILADKYVFSQLMRDLGHMDKSEYEVFKSLYKSFEEVSRITPSRTKACRPSCSVSPGPRAVQPAPSNKARIGASSISVIAQ